MINNHIFEHIDNEKTAYLLGWVASDGSLSDRGFTIAVHEKDRQILEDLRLIIDEHIPIVSKRNSLASISVNSPQIAKDACQWFRIESGKKSHTIKFPELATDELKWAFLRGFFDADGSVNSVEGNKSYPVCNLTSKSAEFLETVRAFCGIPCSHYGMCLEWSGNNALDLLAKLYENAEIALDRNCEQFWFWSTWVPGLNGRGNSGKEFAFQWMRTRADAVAPSKTRASDSGYDLTILEPVKAFGNVTLYTTGIKVRPSYGWYLDVVPRSSISKTGYMLANSVGIIDRTYTGEILIALVKVDPEAPDIKTPIKIAQMIPRPIIHVEFVEVDSLGDTDRGSGGFGSTDIRQRSGG
jgi:dUTP pyrophosphatase